MHSPAYYLEMLSAPALRKFNIKKNLLETSSVLSLKISMKFQRVYVLWMLRNERCFAYLLLYFQVKLASEYKGVLPKVVLQIRQVRINTVVLACIQQIFSLRISVYRKEYIEFPLVISLYDYIDIMTTSSKTFFKRDGTDISFMS